MTCLTQWESINTTMQPLALQNKQLPMTTLLDMSMQSSPTVTSMRR